ncbi:MAG: glycosyltransferase family 39 protein [Gemmatimonadota bacterium]
MTVGTTAARSSGSLWRAAGVVLLSVPFLPLRPWFGPIDGAAALVSGGEWALGIGIFAVMAWLTVLLAGWWIAPIGRWERELRRGGTGSWLTAGLVLLAFLLVAASWIAFHRSPHLIDSVVQLFQAKIFASGALTAPSPPDGGFFSTLHMLVDEAGWYAQYPPGHAGLLAVGVAAGVPWLAPLVLSLGSAGLMYASARRVYGPACARLTLVLLVLCPFFWFMGASFMNHVSALFFVSLFLYLFVRWDGNGGAGWAVAAGAALGAGALIRPLTAVAVAVPFATFALVSGSRGKTARRRSRGGEDGVTSGGGPDAPSEEDSEEDAVSVAASDDGRGWTGLRGLGPVVLAGLGFAAVASLYLLYNAQTTGDPLVPGYLKLWGESHGLGFHETPWGGEHTPLTGLRNELVDLALLNLYLFEWPVPALLPVGAAFALGWTTEGWDRRLLVAFLAIPAAYFFYWHRDDFLGPRFLYSGLVFVLPLTARSLLEAADRLRGRAAQLGNLFRAVDAGAWMAVFLALCAGYAVFYGIPNRFRVYASDTPSMKADLRREAAGAGVDEGLVFVKVSWGNRILSRLRARGVSAGLATRAYRSVDHCDLHLLLERPPGDGGDRRALAAELERRIARDDSLVRTDRLNDDPTLRLRPDRDLDPECREEVEYDRAGYTNYSPHLLVNSPDLSGDLVVARDLRDANRALVDQFSDLSPVLYDGTGFTSTSMNARSGDEHPQAAREPMGDGSGIPPAATEDGGDPR